MIAVDIIPGPFYPGQEQRFKTAVLKEWRKKFPDTSFFPIESPETAPGFPDVISLTNDGRYVLTEFKVSSISGLITFQKLQPLFYKKHPFLHMRVLAWDASRQLSFYIEPKEILAAKSLSFTMHDG
jgi:hypothetical protein